MHHALEVDEILLHIFGHCFPPGLGEDDRKRTASTLAALARVCRAFKEPALDILWSDLEDLSPLSRCLPEVSHVITSEHRDFSIDSYKMLYGFKRPLEQVEWDILRSYTCRIWSIRDFKDGLDWNSVRTFADVPAANSLFPNVRSLQSKYGKEAIPFLNLPFPSLTFLSIFLPPGRGKVNLYMLQDYLKSFAKSSPNIGKLYISSWECQPNPTFSKIVSGCICCWSNLQTVRCLEITLDVDTLVHLSCIPVLTQLTCMVPATLLDQIIPSDSPLSFSHLDRLELRAKSLTSISRLLSRTRLPSIIYFTASIETCPSREDLASFLSGVQTCGMGHTLQDWTLTQLCKYESDPPPIRGSDAFVLDLDDLRPCMAFSNLRSIKLDLGWNVGLTDSQLLALASTWPKLEAFRINMQWGWNTPGGITPEGLAKFLAARRSLNSIALAIDTRGYTESPPSRSSLALKATQNAFSIDVVDSVIEEESTQAMAAFLAGVVPHFDFIFTASECWALMEHPEMETYGERWRDVYDRANAEVKEAFLDLFRPLYFSWARVR